MEFDPTSIGAVAVEEPAVSGGITDTFDPASIGAVPVDNQFDPRSVGAVPVETKQSGLWNSFKESLSGHLANLSAGAVDLLTPMGKRDTERMYAKAGQTPPASLISPEEEQKNEELVSSMRQEASVLRDASQQVFETSDPAAKNLGAQIGRGAASVTSMIPAMLTRNAALPLMALQGAGEAYETSYKAKEDELKSQGVDEETIRDEAIKAGDAAAIKTAPSLLLYMAGGKAAAGLAGKLVGKEASALTTGLVGAGTATVSNVATSSVIRALEAPKGEKLAAALPTIETLTADTLFGVYHGVGEYRNASREAKTKAYNELQDRGFSKEDIKTEPTEQKSEAIVEKTPEEMVVDTVKPATSETPGVLSKAKPQTTGEHIVSTAVNIPGEAPVTSETWNTSHQNLIGEALDRGLPWEQVQDNLGFIVQDANGKQRFASRQEAGQIALKSGQAKELTKEGDLHSEHLKPIENKAWTKQDQFNQESINEIRSFFGIGEGEARRLFKSSDTYNEVLEFMIEKGIDPDRGDSIEHRNAAREGFLQAVDFVNNQKSIAANKISKFNKGGETSAETVRSDQEQVPTGGDAAERGPTAGSEDLQQQTSRPSNEAAPETKVTADQAAETLKPFREQAIDAARKAGATDPELAADTVWTNLANQIAEGKTTLENPGALFSEAARKEGLKQLEAQHTQKRGGGKTAETLEEATSAQAGGPTPAQQAVRTETLDTITEAINTLPNIQKRVMNHTVDGWSDKEIAQEIGIPEPSVRKARQQAREALKEKLSSKIKWTGATDDSSLVDDIRADISAIKQPQKVGALPTGSTAIHDAFTKLKEIGKEALSVGKVNDLRRGILHWVAKVQKSFGEVSDAQKQITKKVRDPVRRSAITDWIEANGDTALLKTRETASKDPKLKDSYKAAQNLTPEEISLAKEIKSVFDTLHQRGVANDVLEGFRDNYVNHIWEKKPQRLTFSTKSLRDSFRFSKARVFNTFFEGEQAGFKPKTKDIAKLLPVYIHEMNSVIAARQLVAQLSKGVASDGRPLVSPTGMMKTVDTPKGKSYLVVPKIPKNADTRDYRVLQDQPALTSWRWKGEDAEGNPIFVKSDLALHPEAYDRLRKALGGSEIRRWYNSEGSKLASIPKAIVKGIDVTQQTVKQTMLGFLSTFHVVQEGFHGGGHKINPFHVPKIDLNDPAQYDAAKHGLMLNPDRISESLFMEGVGQSGIISRIPGVGKVADAFSSWMFHEFIPGLKYKTYAAILRRNTARFEPELKSGEVSLEEIKVLSSEQTNAAYGHLNYADLGRDPTMQHLLQLALLAPDFLEARGRFAAQASKALVGAKSGREQFAAIALLGTAQFVVSQIINKLVDGEFHFDHPFEVIIGGRRYTLRSVPEDLFNMIKDTRRFVYGRINPLVGKGSIQLITGQNYRGEQVDAKETMTELLAQAIPLTLQPLPGVRSLTETGRNQPTSPLEQFAGSMGLRISRYSPISEVYQMASKWEDEQGIPRDKGSYPVSKYQQLRYALEDGDEEKARKEIEKLHESMKRDKIISGFEESIQHPFTQSQAMDVKFSKTLSPKDYAKYKLAREKRKDILRRFYRVIHP